MARKRKAGRRTDVGYGRPPKETQFKTGQSGNPSGRPKKTKDMDDIIARALMAPIEIKIKGRKRRVPAIEAIFLQERSKALSGDLRSARFLLDLYEGRGLAGPGRGSSLDLTDAKKKLRERLSQALGKNDSEDPEREEDM